MLFAQLDLRQPQHFNGIFSHQSAQMVISLSDVLGPGTVANFYFYFSVL